MFRLIKLAAYGLLGYVIYEMVMGMNDAVAEQSSGGGQSSGRQQGGQNRSGGAGGGIQGRRKVTVQDSNGAETSARVGRGVVSH